MALYTKDGTLYVDPETNTYIPGQATPVKVPASPDLLEWDGWREVVTIEGEGTDGVAEVDGKTVWQHYTANGDIAATPDETEEEETEEE